MLELDAALGRCEARGARVCPGKPDIFRAFQLTALDNVRVVIVGQDPYHQAGVATGLAFSAADGRRRPRSAARILNQASDNLALRPIKGANLESWAKYGVLLLNTVLTVEESEPKSHQGIGWECFTNRAIQLVNDRDDRKVVFMLWGDEAKRKKLLIDTRHEVLEAAHPSSRSKSSNFSSCKHFKKANEFLATAGEGSVCWNLPPCNPGECAASPACEGGRSRRTVRRRG
jgi:uracil-DNA glycosylase